MLRAHLIMNPEARGVTPSLQHLMATALEARFKLDVTEPRRMSLGLANDRYFTFACGCGFDAEAAARVESHRSAKRRYGEPYFYAAALATFAASYAVKKPFLTCEGEFGTEEVVLAVGLVGHAYAYLAGRPLRLSPNGPPDGGLGLFMVRRLSFVHLPRYAFGAVTGRFGPGAVSLAELDEFSVS